MDDEDKAVCPFNQSESAFSLPESDQARLKELDRYHDKWTVPSMLVTAILSSCSQLEAILPIMRWDSASSCSRSELERGVAAGRGRVAGAEEEGQGGAADGRGLPDSVEEDETNSQKNGKPKKNIG